LDNPVFLADRGEEDWTLIVRAAQLQRLAPGDVVVHAGDPVRTLYLVMDGTLRGEPADGPPRPVIGPSVAGELAFLDAGPQELTLVAETTATVLFLDHDAFLLLADAHPDLGRAMLADLARLVCGRLRGASEVLGR